MGEVDWNRLQSLESRLGRRLTAEFVATIVEREPVRQGRVALVTAHRIWDVRTVFSLDAGSESDQLDEV